MQKYYTECRSHFNSTIFGRRIEEGWCLANPVWSLILSKMIVSSCHYTHTQKVLKLFLNYSQLQVAGDFGPKRQQPSLWENATADETPRLVTFLGHFQWATSSHWKKIWRNKNLEVCNRFLFKFLGHDFLPKDTHHLFKRKRKKVDLPGKIQVVINFHQLETPYNQQSSSL